MKVLYLGHYKEFGGWGRAAIDQILALDSVGVEVVCRPVALSSSVNENIPQRIMELEEKSINNITHCIQHLLPHKIVETKGLKNIAYFVDETIHYKQNFWHTYLNTCDQVLVPNHDMKNNLTDILDTKVDYIPHTFNVEEIVKHKTSTKPLSSIFKFYLTAELSDRKNILSVIKAYFSEFDKTDNTTLFLKINKFGFTANQLTEVLGNNIIPHLLKKMKLSKPESSLPNITPITDRITDEQVYELHNICDCFVMPSHGEAWCIPAFEAMMFGNTPICSNDGGPKDFIDKDNKNTGSLISGTRTIPESGDSAFNFIHTGDESWFQPNEIEMKKQMRFYYENSQSIDRNEGLERAKQFDYKIIGQKLKETIE